MRALIAVAVLLCSASSLAQTDSWNQRPAVPGSKVTIEDRPCCSASHADPKSDRAEAAVLAQLSDRASRDGQALRLKLDGNRSLKVTDCDDQSCAGSTYRVHRLIAWWPRQRYYVVRVGFYDGEQSGWLIRESDGLTVSVAGPPILSPSAQRAIAWDGSPSGQGLQLIDMMSDPPTIFDVKSKPACPGTKQQYSLRPQAVWIDDTHVTFEGKSIFDGDDPDAKQILRIVDGKPRWEC